MLADDSRRNVLVYSLAGPAIGLTRALAHGSNAGYSGWWFDPRTGQTSAASLPAHLHGPVEVAKPDGREWLLLLRER